MSSTGPRIPRPQSSDGSAASWGVLGHQPELMAAFSRLYGHLWSRGVLDHATKEIVRLRNARVTDCRFCKNVRFSVAREQGVSDALVALIDDDHAGSALSPRHKAALAFTDVFLRDPGSLDEATREALRREFTPAEIVELTAAVALFVGFSKIVVALDTAPESMPTTILPTPE